ncbi:MAG: HemK2/MTQ2 family protein methyltransferase [Candidatus Natronoplasma sp.]
MNFIDDFDIEVLEGVYEPSEDTYLILEILELDDDEDVLELGCGTGVISLYCSSKGCNVLSVDKDMKALKNTEKNAKKNDIDISVQKSDLFSNIAKQDWDTIIFNPPYLPEKKDLPKDERWDGGEKGDEIIVKFLKRAGGYLNDDGELYFCYSSLSPEDKIREVIKCEYRVIDKKIERFFFENLYGFRLKKK